MRWNSAQTTGLSRYVNEIPFQCGLSDARLLAGAQAFAKRYAALDPAVLADRLADRLALLLTTAG
jgi:hypothetical protein